MNEICRRFDTNYKQVGKHRMKCRFCGKLIQDNDQVRMISIRTEKYYPVKGIMIFNKWISAHIDCINKSKDQGCFA